jgi:hypothetical protein
MHANFSNQVLGGAPVYPGPRYPPRSGYPPPGYRPDERWREEQAFSEHCERFESAEHEIQDRLAFTPYGEERERCWRR